MIQNQLLRAISKFLFSLFLVFNPFSSAFSQQMRLDTVKIKEMKIKKITFNKVYVSDTLKFRIDSTKSIEICEFDSLGMLASFTKFYDNKLLSKESYLYDKQKNLLKVRILSYQTQHEHIIENINVYDENMCLKAAVHLDSNLRFMNLDQFEYDNHFRQVKRICYNAKYSFTSIDKTTYKQRIIKNEYLYHNRVSTSLIYKYNRNGLLVESSLQDFDHNKKFKNIFIYDKNGILKKKVNFEQNFTKPCFVDEYIYNSKGLLIYEKIDGVYRFQYEYEFYK
jgi:hypothetical protein